jgi:transcriptional regulator
VSGQRSGCLSSSRLAASGEAFESCQVDVATYPPLPYQVNDPERAVPLVRDYPFAHLFTAHGDLRATRIPFVADIEDGRPIRLRAHLDALNPQSLDLDGAAVLVAFSGPAAYVSPHWRADKTKGGTYDYEEVQVRGTARIVRDLEFFERLINDLSALIEPQHAEIGDYAVWRTSRAPPGHIARQVKWVTPFVVDIKALQVTAKLPTRLTSACRNTSICSSTKSPTGRLQSARSASNMCR